MLVKLLCEKSKVQASSTRLFRRHRIRTYHCRIEMASNGIAQCANNFSRAQAKTFLPKKLMTGFVVVVIVCVCVLDILFVEQRGLWLLNDNHYGLFSNGLIMVQKKKTNAIHINVSIGDALHPQKILISCSVKTVKEMPAKSFLQWKSNFSGLLVLMKRKQIFKPYKYISSLNSDSFSHFTFPYRSRSLSLSLVLKHI